MTPAYGERGHQPPGKFNLVVASPDLEGFEGIEPATYKVLQSGHKVPDLCDVTFPDGSVRRGRRADEIVYALVPDHIPDAIPIILTLDRAAHIKALHIDGEDSGSVFFEGTTLETILTDISTVLPEVVITGKYKKEAFDLDMGRDYGWENLVGVYEALSSGLISEGVQHLIEEYHREITRVNLNGTGEQKLSYAEWFNQKFAWSEIFLKVIREDSGGVIVPHIYGEPHTTSSVMMALSRRRQVAPVLRGYRKYRRGRQEVQYLHTISPGRSMNKHPIPGQHTTGKERRLDMKSFKTSGYNWTHHFLILPPPDTEESDGESEIREDSI